MAWLPNLWTIGGRRTRREKRAPIMSDPEFGQGGFRYLGNMEEKNFMIGLT